MWIKMQVIVWITLAFTTWNGIDGTSNSSEMWTNEPSTNQCSSPLFKGERTTLTDLGVMTIKMVEAIAKDAGSKEVDLAGLTQLITSLSKASVFFDNPKEMQQYDIEEKLLLLEERMSKIEKENSQLIQSLEESKDLTDYQYKNMGFSAYLSYNQSVTNGTIIKFDKMIQNSSYYDSAFGYFSCPVDGSYFVSYMFAGKMLSSYNNQWNQFAFAVIVGNKKYENNVMTLFASVSGSVIVSDVTGSTVVHCQPKKKIWIESIGSGKVEGSATHPITMMTVHLLHARGNV